MFCYVLKLTCHHVVCPVDTDTSICVQVDAEISMECVQVDVDKAGRQVVYFKAIKIAPVESGKDALQRWLDVFKAENPSMVTFNPFNYHLIHPVSLETPAP